MSFVIGIDGGGTSTRACIMDGEGMALAVGKSGPSSVDTVALSVTEASIRDAVTRAVEQLPVLLQKADSPRFEAVMAGLGGIVSTADRQSVEAILARIPGVVTGAPVFAANDMKIALAGGTAMQPGIVTIMGTGSVTYGRDTSGREHKTGGWGWKEGDPGSSFDLGISAIRAYVRAGDGRVPFTDFTRDVQKRLGITDVADITTLLYQNDMSRTEIASLAPLVTTWADRDDSVAVSIVERACAEVRDQIETVFRVVFEGRSIELSAHQRPSDHPMRQSAGIPTTSASTGGGPTVENVFVGSLGNAPGRFRDTLIRLVGAISPRIKIIENRREPVEGAALWAVSLIAK